jgi:hypothetical protein
LHPQKLGMRSAAMIHPQYHVEVSKIMSKIPRHKGVKYGTMGADASAWVSVDDLARAGRLMGCEQDLIEVAKTSEKRKKTRFEVRVQGNGCFVRSTRKHTGLQLKAMYGGRDRASEVHLAGPLQKPHQLLRDGVHRSPAAATMAIFASHQLEECERHCLPPARSICSSRQPTPRSRHFQWNRHPHHSRTAVMKKERSPCQIYLPFPNEPSFV